MWLHDTTLWCWDSETMRYDAKKRKAGLGSHLLHTWTGRQCWPLSGSHLRFKNDHSAWLQMGFFFFYRSGNSSVPSICLFFPTFYSSAMVMDDKAQGVSGVPWTKVLWPSALAWLCQSLALLTAEWNVQWYSTSSRGLPYVANREATGELWSYFEKTQFWSKTPVGMLTLLLWCHSTVLWRHLWPCRDLVVTATNTDKQILTL